MNERIDLDEMHKHRLDLALQAFRVGLGESGLFFRHSGRVKTGYQV